MREETRLDILSAEQLGMKYDEAAKVLWRNREILAPLLKYALTELKDESVEDIISLIDSSTISEGVPVSDLPPAIDTLDSQLSSTTEKLITYDLRFLMVNPKLSTEKLLVLLHIDGNFDHTACRFRHASV